MDNKQHRRITFQRRERNKVSPTMSLAYFLERGSRPESSEGVPTEPGGPAEWKKWSLEFREVRVARICMTRY